jgi:hypothetical protein
VGLPPPPLAHSPIQALAASMRHPVSLQLLYLGQSVGLLGWVISSSQGLCLYTNINIHAQSRIRTHGPSVHASENSLCLRPLSYCRRHIIISGVRHSPLGTVATTGLLYQPQMIVDGDCGAIGGMKIDRGTEVLAPLCPPQIPHDQTEA